MSFVDLAILRERWHGRILQLLAGVSISVAALLYRSRLRRLRGIGRRFTNVEIDIPAPLVQALRENNAVAVLGLDFVFPAGAPSLLHLVKQLLPAQENNAGSTCDAAAPQCLAEATGAELQLGVACESLGPERVWRELRAAVQQARQRGARCAADVRRRVAALADAPFTAILSEAWSAELEDSFPHRVGLNFGGFAALLSRPRVDAAPGRARPALQLWPAVLGGGRAAKAALPATRSECEKMLAADSPYSVFLRDVFESKAVLLLGWPSRPPDGCLGSALRAAWQRTRARDPQRVEPIAYAFAEGQSALDGAFRQRCREACGLYVFGSGEVNAPDGITALLEQLGRASASATSST